MERNHAVAEEFKRLKFNQSDLLNQLVNQVSLAGFRTLELNMVFFSFLDSGKVYVGTMDPPDCLEFQKL